jgi:hypothetical protein
MSEQLEASAEKHHRGRGYNDPCETRKRRVLGRKMVRKGSNLPFRGQRGKVRKRRTSPVHVHPVKVA